MNQPLLTRDLSVEPSTTFVREAGVKPSSVNESERTAELVWATSAGVRRRDPMAGEYLERLSMDARHVDMTRLNSGNAPVLNSHRSGRAEDVVGVVVNARIENGQGIATVRFSERADVENIWRDIVSGIIRNVSVGYQVHEYKESRGDNGETVMTAMRWEPMEISVVPVGADSASHIRSHNNNAAAPTNQDAETDQARSQGIQDLVSLAGFSDDMARSMVQRGLTVDDARRELLHMRDQRIFDDTEINGQLPSEQHEMRGGARVNWSADDPNVRRAAMVDAIAARVAPGGEAPQGLAREFMGRSIPEMCRTILEWNGESTLGLEPASLVQRTMSGLHTTSDFQFILGEVANKTLRKSYEAAPAALKVIGREAQARDFRERHNIILDAPGELEELNEHQEIPYGTLYESEETYKIMPHSRRFGLSFEAMVNDDLQVLSDHFRVSAKWAQNTEAIKFIRLLTLNSGLGPTMKADDKTLFHADHGNLAGTGAALDVTTLGAARQAMRKQKGLDGESPINVTPKFLVVPASLETTAEQVLTDIQATKVSDVNPHAGKLELVVDPRLDDVSEAAWYLAANPYEFDTIEYAYLSGWKGPQVDVNSLFNKLGWEFRVVLHFGVGVVDWRGMYRNAGE